MATVRFADSPKSSQPIRFKDLSLNESFKIRSAEAIYRKVQTYKGDFWMLEEVTGQLFPATDSLVERVSVEINIGQKKPSIY